MESRGRDGCRPRTDIVEALTRWENTHQPLFDCFSILARSQLGSTAFYFTGISNCKRRNERLGESYGCICIYKKPARELLFYKPLTLYMRDSSLRRHLSFLWIIKRNVHCQYQTSRKNWIDEYHFYLCSCFNFKTVKTWIRKNLECRINRIKYFMKIIN